MPAEWALPRIRQAVLATGDLPGVVSRLREALGPGPDPYRDAGVGQFGLDNAVLSVGDSFLEVLTPVLPDTAVGRHLARRGGDAGYMVMLQVAGTGETRDRLTSLGVRIVWQVELPDAVDLHLHPKDVPGALVAVDVMRPDHSWRWGGPGFTGPSAPSPEPAGGIVGLTLAVDDPATAAQRWAAVAGLPSPVDLAVDFAGGAQRVVFEPATPERAGLVEIAVARPGPSERLLVGTTNVDIIGITGREGRHG